MELDGLIRIDQITARKISERKSSDIFATIPSSKLMEYIEEGWEAVPTKYKNKSRVKKPKSHNDAFEDRIWALLARMRFRSLNKDKQFKIEYEPGISKQIDVFGLDEEAAVVIECKSSFERRRVSYYKEINELIGYKEKIRAAIRKACGKEYKVAFLFATNNSIISDNDRARLKNENVLHFNQDDFGYFEQLTEHLGPAAKYQFFGKIFASQKVPGLRNRVPAIKGKMASGHSFYSFSIEPEFLLKIGFILHRVDTSPDTAIAYQRLVKRDRLIEIGNYVNNGGYFPNSIIINLQTSSNKELKFEPASNQHDSNTSLGVLHLPQVYKSAFIIDGQHRLYGYSRVQQDNHLIPVVAFHNLPEEEQSKIFVDINHKQKSVQANTLRSIMADFNWNSSDAVLAMSALKTRILSDMNCDERSPFYKRVILSEEKKTEERCLTLQTLVSWGFGRVDFFGKTKGKELVKTGFLYDGNYDKTLSKSIEFFNVCFQLLEDKLAHQWSAGSAEGGFIAMNSGVSATFRVINDIVTYLVKEEEVRPEELTGAELALRVIPYLEVVVNFINSLDAEGVKKLRGLFGAGAPEKILREFQYAINKAYPPFLPEGLDQWIKEHSGQYNARCYDTGSFIEKHIIDANIKSILQKRLGERNWWTEGVPTKTQIECSKRRIEKKSNEHDSNFLDLIDYADIISNNWDILGNLFTPPGLENAAKAKRIEWLVKFNLIRQKYSHPQRENTTEEEFAFLEHLKRWLEERFKM